MRGGQLRNQITIQSRTQSGTDRQNAPIYTWATFKEVFSEIFARRGGEKFSEENKQRVSQDYYMFRCRFYDVDGVNATMRILFDGQLYDIRGVMPDHNRRGHVLIEATLQDGTL